MRFTKMHGAGNDFVVLDLRDGLPAPDPAHCARIADRHAGVGCDQLLTVEPPRQDGSVASYRIWNADGSAAGQCGNGARCIAAWLVREGVAPAHGAFAIDSPGGTHRIERDADGGFVVDMGIPAFAQAAVPLSGFDAVQDLYAVDIEGRQLQFGAVSMGNPHAVIEVDDAASAAVAQLGPALQASGAFPQSVNVGFAQVLAPDRVRLRVFERGAGETLACGSGACAAVAVLARRGRIDAAHPVMVELPGGTLRIRYDQAGDGCIRMGGPAAFVFEGTLLQWSRA
jgi:diaminopimelate epimerase